MTWKMGPCIGMALASIALLGAAPPNGGTIAIEPQIADGKTDPRMPVVMQAVSDALTNKGFTIFDDPAHAAYRAELTVSRDKAGIGMGKTSHGDQISGAGAGVVVPLPTGNSDVIALQRTQLELRIRKREDGSIVWDGTAVTVRATDNNQGTDRAVASALAGALLQVYPVQPRGVVGVP